ncbi:MAG: ABC transporter permease subunit [Gemmatimonadota bacterium]
MRRVLLLYELKMLLRDTRTVLITVVAPLVLFPAFLYISRSVERSEERRLEETTYRYAVAGDSAGWARSLLADALALDPADTSEAPTRFEEVRLTARVPVESDAVDSTLQAEDLHLLVRGMSPAAFEAATLAEEVEAGTEASDDESDEAQEDEEPPPEVPVVRLEYRTSNDFGRRAAGVLRERLEQLRDVRRDSLFRARGFPVAPDEVAALDAVNTASAEREGGALLGLALTPFLLALMLTGGSIVAADAISGEKERGTLETLLTTAMSRSEMVQAKLMAVVVVGLAVAAVNILNLLVYVVLDVFELPADFAVDLSSLDLALLLTLFVPVVVLVASALLLLSGYSKSYREYQIYFFPLFLALMAPSLAVFLPGMELRSAIALVPISGVGVAVKEVMVGEYDWPFLLLAFASTGAAGWWLARLTERTLSTERLVGGAELDEADLRGGPALFPRRVLRWFAVMWAVFFVVSGWVGADLDIRGQLALNLVVLFFGGSLLMLRRYRLPVREALSLRPVPLAVWPAVLIGAPSALVVGVGLANLVNAYVFPVPDQVLEAFSESLVGDELPLWQMVLFLCVMPGIFEEIAFRGLLLHGLRRYLKPVALCLAVGVVFGMFHVSLFRIVPTAYLGAVLAAVVLLSGSIYPAMLWHALNNALGIVPAELGWIEPDAALPGWSYPVGVVGLAIAFALVWVHRRRPVERNLHGSPPTKAGAAPPE